ncbi:hypothetical protein J3F84DRAFT_399783 [Trichoderma pleuroticola]
MADAHEQPESSTAKTEVPVVNLEAVKNKIEAFMAKEEEVDKAEKDKAEKDKIQKERNAAEKSEKENLDKAKRQMEDAIREYRQCGMPLEVVWPILIDKACRVGMNGPLAGCVFDQIVAQMGTANGDV